MPRGARTTEDRNLLEAALEGLQAQKQRIEEQIQHVEGLLGRARRGRRPAAASASAAASQDARPRRRELSAAARKRIAAAQKKRWAEYRKQQKAAG